VPAVSREDFVVALETRLLLGFATNEVAAARSEVSCHIARSAERWWERVLRFVLTVALRKRRQHREEPWRVQQGQERVGCRYVLGWVTGLIFYFIDKRPFVRFHAAQSIVVFGGLTIIRIVCGMLFLTGTGFHMGLGLLWLVSLVGFILWILLMVKAYQGDKYRVPIAADLADQIFGKS
jgi:uncharacterized membrane protein